MQTQAMELPAVFGKYRLVGHLGKGGMAHVYLAELCGPFEFQKLVAIKLIDRRAVDSKSKMRALVNEAKVGGQLRHKNIVDIFEFDEIDGNWFIAMEYVEGWTLEDLVMKYTAHDRPIPESVAFDICYEVCDGLAHAHELKGGGNLEHDCMAELTWNESGEQRRVVVSLVLSDQNPHAMLSYDEYGRYWNYRVPMESVPCYFGGKRWYFRCPLAVNGVHCGARVAILYKNGEVFGCRTCQNLSYSLQNVTHTGTRADFYRVMQAMRWGGKINKLRTKYWKGRLTKRQRRRIENMERYQDKL